VVTSGSLIRLRIETMPLRPLTSELPGRSTAQGYVGVTRDVINVVDNTQTASYTR
jgi:hypothetical protein